MAMIRAYKIAEELGIERTELVEKARAAGFELENPMVRLTEEQAEELRQKLGARSPRADVVERRVERSGGAAVIRRRRRVVAEPPPPEPEPAPAAEAIPEPVAEVAAVPAEEAEPAEEAAPQPAAEEAPEPTPEPEPAPEPAPAVATGAPQPAPAPRREGEAEQRPQPPGRGRERKRVREVVNLREQEQIARQVTSRVAPRRAVTVDPRTVSSPRRRRRDAPTPRPAAAAAPKPTRRVVRVEGSITVAELARQLGAKAAEVQGKLLAQGTLAQINQAIDLETAAKVAKIYGFEVQDVSFKEDAFLAPEPEAVDESKLVPRPPVITVMGHVDHGKTSLLDAIRKTRVVEGEAGGITQHIGAYQVQVGDHKLTFIDTPGHEAFTEMRARGAQVTDLVVLVVAANDGVMPQTIEAISHARDAGVPIVVAVNKVDLPDANPQLVRQRLMEHGVVTEDFGGDTIAVDVSATQGRGIDQLLEMLALQAEVLELKANPEGRAHGVVLEAELDRGRGPVATVLVRNGTLRRGDVVVSGTAYGRVRAMLDDSGRQVKEAGPSAPVQVVGLSEVPDVGERIDVVESERVAKQIVDSRLEARRKAPAEAKPRVSLEELFARVDEDAGPRELKVVLKADVRGSCEALREALLKLSTDKVKVSVIHEGVGAIGESDVMLAKASGAIVIGFGVRPDPAARRSAESQGVDLRTYRVIYEVVDEVKKAMAGLLPPTVKEKVLGQAEVREIFNVPRVGTIAGCMVTEGVVRRGARCRLLREGVVVYDGRIGSLRRFKEDVREVQSGFECGIGIENFNDVKVGDVIEVYDLEETPAEL